MTRSREHRHSQRPLAWAASVAPLLLTLAPRSPLAHDEGYYQLQARWIALSGHWLAPLWWGAPVFDRTIGVQWLIASAQTLLGPSSWAAHLPSLLAAIACLLLTGLLAEQLLGPGQGWLSALVLALTPLWLNYAHQASQDMPLLALELLGVWALLQAEPDQHGPWSVLAGLWLGPAFLIKGFMAVLPAIALAPLLWQRRWLLTAGRFWMGLLLGILPPALWLGLSLQVHGAAVVGGLWEKLLFLSRSESYAAGPLYYLWNIPANTAPWCLAALAGWWLLLRRPLARDHRLVLLLYPVLLVLLLSSFRTKTPYYGLQLTPWIAMAAACGLQRWSEEHAGRRWWLNGVIVGCGALLLVGAAGLAWSPEAQGLPPRWLLVLSAAGLGGSWLALSWATGPRQRLLALLMGPWLALVLLVQGGLFSDRSPGLRLALMPAAIQAELRRQPIEAAAASPLSGEDHATLILLALATPRTPTQLLDPAAVTAGQRVWIRRHELGSGPWRLLLKDPALQGWVLAERPPQPADTTGVQP
jgi:4-amino-4-deoxy-L-arabinose transferase-like glycosyltransferase